MRCLPLFGGAAGPVECATRTHPPSSLLLITLGNTQMLQRRVLQIATHHLARKSDYDLHTGLCGFFIRP